MNVEKLEKLPPPPGIIGSLRAGFDVVSSHIWLIFMPILFDAFLWLGPRFSVREMYASFVALMLDTMKSRPVTPEQVQAVKDSVEPIGNFNWLGLARTFPIGVPSLEALFAPEKLSLHTPFGMQQVISVDSMLILLPLTFFIMLAGWVGGGLYFRWVAAITLGSEEAGIGVTRALVQTFIVSAIWIACLMVVIVPVLIVVSLAGLLSQTLANVTFFIITLLLYWLIVPFFFMPHGIFTRRLNALLSLYASLRMSRFTLPTSGLFVFAAIVLTRGLNFLWSVPENDSWMKLVGISGHAFISTTLLSASFVYYRDINIWLQTVLEQLQRKQSVPTQQA